MPIEDSAKVPEPQCVSDVRQIAFENTADQRRTQDAHPSSSEDKPQPEFIFDQARQRLVESVKRIPRLAANGKHRGNTPRVGQDCDSRRNCRRPDELSRSVGGSIGNGWSNGGDGLVTKGALTTIDEQIVESEPGGYDDEE
jgi:hypothetical protein